MGKLNFHAFLETALATYPDAGEPEAERASRIMAGWRVACRAAGREPFTPPADANAKEAPEVVAAWRERATAEGRKAHAWRYSGHSSTELAAAWLAVHLRTPSGQPMAKEG